MTLMAEVLPVFGAEASLRAVPLRLERARGIARISVCGTDGQSRLDRLYQSGSAKVRLPRVATGAPLEAILINTAGGVTGGDEIAYEVAVGIGGAAVIATQAAERIYRRSAGTAI